MNIWCRGIHRHVQVTWKKHSVRQFYEQFGGRCFRYLQNVSDFFLASFLLFKKYLKHDDDDIDRRHGRLAYMPLETGAAVKVLAVRSWRKFYAMRVLASCSLAISPALGEVFSQCVLLRGTCSFFFFFFCHHFWDEPISGQCASTTFPFSFVVFLYPPSLSVKGEATHLQHAHLFPSPLRPVTTTLVARLGPPLHPCCSVRRLLA